MVNMSRCVMFVLILAMTAKSDHCVDEKNDFRIVEVDLAESTMFPDQALITVTGYFQLPQHVTMMTFDYTLDGFNWLRAIKKLDEDFEADVFSVFMVSVAFEGFVTEDAKAVVGFTEDNEVVWCSLVDLTESYGKRRLVS